MDPQTNILLTPDSIDVDASLRFIQAEEAGGSVIFIGTVRNQTQGKRVIRLEFEAYEPMAVAEMQRLAARALEQWPVYRISMQHRTGTLEVGDIPVVIAVSAAHRKAAFEACQYLIDTLKDQVPIWKKEYFEDGAVWVAAHP